MEFLKFRKQTLSEVGSQNFFTFLENVMEFFYCENSNKMPSCVKLDPRKNY